MCLQAVVLFTILAFVSSMTFGIVLDAGALPVSCRRTLPDIKNLRPCGRKISAATSE